MPKNDHFFPKSILKIPKTKDSPYLDPKSRIKEWICRRLLYGIPQLHCIDIPIIGKVIGWKKWISQIHHSLFLELVPEYVF